MAFFAPSRLSRQCSSQASDMVSLQFKYLVFKQRRPEDARKQMSDIWAPELHIVDDYWWVYFCAAHPSQGNPSHRMYVLRGPHFSSDPMEPTSRFTFEGQMAALAGAFLPLCGKLVRSKRRQRESCQGAPIGRFLYGLFHGERQSPVFRGAAEYG